MKISKVKRKGRLCESDISPIRITFACFILLEEEIVFSLDLVLVVITVLGRGDFEVTFKEFNKMFYCCFSLLTSYSEMLALVFFISSIILYSIRSEITTFLEINLSGVALLIITEGGKVLGV